MRLFKKEGRERERESWQREDEAPVGSTSSRLLIQQSAALWGSVCDRISAVCLCALGHGENQHSATKKGGEKGLGEAAFA